MFPDVERDDVAGDVVLRPGEVAGGEGAPGLPRPEGVHRRRPDDPARLRVGAHAEGQPADRLLTAAAAYHTVMCRMEQDLYLDTLSYHL